MITSKRQYLATKAAIREFELARKHGEASSENGPVERAMREAIESDIDAMRAEVAEYEKISTGEVRELAADLSELGSVLALARTAKGLTQTQLADLIGVKRQQIQRYETSEYEAASFARIKEIMWGMGIQIHLQAELGDQPANAVSRKVIISQPARPPTTVGWSHLTAAARTQSPIPNTSTTIWGGDVPIPSKYSVDMSGLSVPVPTKPIEYTSEDALQIA